MKTFIGSIMTANGKNYLTAVNGGGLGGPDTGTGLVALHTDATTAKVWETFSLILQPGSPPLGPGMKFALKTSGGYYVTAVSGGGIGGPNNATCPIHTDAASVGAWETVTLVVNDAVNPPTVQIMPFGVQPTYGSCFVTAVNGGGVGGANTVPVHTDAKTVGAWEQFTFVPPKAAAANPPAEIVIAYNTNINGPANGNIAGSVILTMSPDGGWTFSGKMNNSNWLPYDIALGLVVLSSKGTAFTFTYKGSIDAGLPWDNNNLSWNSSGNSAAIQAHWGEFTTWTWYTNYSATLDVGSIIKGLENTIGAAISDLLPVIAAIVG